MAPKKRSASASSSKETALLQEDTSSAVDPTAPTNQPQGECQQPHPPIGVVVEAAAQPAASREEVAAHDAAAAAAAPAPLPRAPVICPLCLRPEVEDPVVLPPHSAPADGSNGNVCLVCRDCAHDWLLTLSHKHHQHSSSRTAATASSAVPPPTQCPQCRGDFGAGALDDAFEDAGSILTLAEAEDALLRQNSTKQLGKKASSAAPPPVAAIVPRNLPLSSSVAGRSTLLSSAGQQQQQQQLVCGICEAAEGAMECAQCQFLICDGCQGTVHSKGMFRRHDVTPLPPAGAPRQQQHQQQQHKNKLCQQHPSTTLDLFCHTCASGICVLCCFSGPHRAHTVAPLAEVAQALQTRMAERQAIVSQCASVAGAVAHRLSEASPLLRQRTAAVETLIVQTFARLREAVDDRQRTLLQELDAFVSRQVSGLASQGEGFRLVEQQAQRLLAGSAVLGAWLHPGDLVRAQQLIEGRLGEIPTLLQTLTPSASSRPSAAAVDAPLIDAESICRSITEQLVPSLEDVVFVAPVRDTAHAMALFAAELEKCGTLKLPAARPPPSMVAISDSADHGAAAALVVDRRSASRASGGGVASGALPVPSVLFQPNAAAAGPPALRIGGSGGHRSPDRGGPGGYDRREPVAIAASSVEPMLSTVSKRRQYLSLADEQAVGEPPRSKASTAAHSSNPPPRTTMPNLGNMFTSLPKRGAATAAAGGSKPTTPGVLAPPPTADAAGAGNASPRRTTLPGLQLRL